MDENVVEDNPGFPSNSNGGMFNAISRIESRVAALEAGSRAEIAALKRDTEAIRLGGHELREELQKIVAVVITEQATMKGHMISCDKRGARLERLGMAALATMLTVLAFLIKLRFFPGGF